MRRRLAHAVALALALLARSAGGDVDPGEYAAGRSLAAHRRAELATQVADETRREATRRDEEARATATRAAIADAAAQARPLAERLLEQRCTRCHPADHYLMARHTPLGWHAVLTRMRWLNDAAVPWSEQRVIVRHLAEIRPADAPTAAAEYLYAAGTMGLPALLAWVTVARSRRR